MRAFFTALLVFVVVAVCFSPDAASGHGVFWYHDFRHHHYPWREWAAQAWHRGEVPWWAPGAANGFPLLAEGQGGFLYPPTMLLFYALPAPLALDWSVLGHQVWGALGIWAFVRAQGLRGTPPLLAGVAWAFGGFLVSHTLYLGMQNGAAWLGWALWGTQARKPTMSALAVGMMGLAGHPQAAAFCGLLFGLHALAQRAWGSLVGGLVGVGIAAPQLVASLELSGFSMRDGGVGDLFAQVGKLPVQELVNGVLPYAFGLDRPADIAETYYHRGTGYWGAGENHWEMCFYLGIPVVVCALSAVRRQKFWTAVAAVGLLLMLGGPAWMLLRHLPGFGYFRFPARFGLWVSFATAVLSAHGLDHLRTMPRLWLVRRRVLGVALAFGAATFVAFVGLRVGKDTVEALGTAHFQKEVVALPPPPDLGPLLGAALPAPEPEDPAQIPGKVARIYADLLESTRPDSLRVVVPMALLLLSALLVRHPRRLVLLATLDLWWFGHAYHPTMPVQDLDAPPVWLTSEMTEPGGPRLTVLDRRIDPALDTRMLTASLGLPLGTNDVLIPSPLLLVRNEAVLGLAGLDVGDKGEAKVGRWFRHRDLSRRMGVRWLATTHLMPGLPMAASAPDFTVWEDPTALPRARVVPCRVGAADGEAAYTAVTTADPEKVVIVEGAEDACAAGGTATVRNYTDQDVIVDVTGAGTLVLADTWYPRWRAFVDGVETPILRADVLFRAVPFAEGARQIELRFDPGLPGKLLPLAAVLTLGATLGLGKQLLSQKSAMNRAGA